LNWGNVPKKKIQNYIKEICLNLINLGQDNSFCEDGRQNSMYDEKQVTLTMIK
jgi:hypothetical protein